MGTGSSTTVTLRLQAKPACEAHVTDTGARHAEQVRQAGGHMPPGVRRDGSLLACKYATLARHPTASKPPCPPVSVQQRAGLVQQAGGV